MTSSPEGRFASRPAPASRRAPNGGNGGNGRNGATRSRAEDALSRFHEEDRIKTSYDARMLLRIWPYVRPHGGPLLLSLLLLLVGSALAMLRPLVMRAAFDAFGAKDASSELTRAGITVGVIMLLEQSIAFPQVYLMQRSGARAMADLRLAVFRFLHTRKMGFFDRTPVGRLVTRVTNDVDAVNEMFASGALNAFGDLVRLAAIVVILVWLDYKMSLLAFAALPIVAAFVNWTRRRIRDAFREVRSKTARMNAYLNEQISGMAVVQAYAREAACEDEFDAINLAYRNANNRSIIYDSALDAAIEMVSSLCIASVLWYAGVRAGSVHITFGTLFAFVAYIEMFFVPIRDSRRATPCSSRRWPGPSASSSSSTTTMWMPQRSWRPKRPRPSPRPTPTQPSSSPR